VTEAADFIDAALHYESSWERAELDRERFAVHYGDANYNDNPVEPEVEFYGSSVGAVRGTVRNALLRYPGMSHDEVTALASELWSAAVYERRLAAIVLLQSFADQLIVTDLTRLEGFVRTAGLDALVTPLATDVIHPLVASLDGREAAKANVVMSRWRNDGDPALRRIVDALES
jgi:hypothetical protein